MIPSLYRQLVVVEILALAAMLVVRFAIDIHQPEPNEGARRAEIKEVYYENTCIRYAKHLIVVNANYGSCSGSSGTPKFEDIVINGAKSENSVSGVYEELAGYISSNLAQLYIANIDLDSDTQSGDEARCPYCVI